MTINIGFIGLGKMGGPMVLNLLKRHKVYVYDINEESQSKLVKQGAIACANLAILCSNVSYIIIMLPTGRQVEEVCTNQQGVFNNCLPNTIVIDCSSIDIQTSIKLHSLAAKKNISMLDAPVSGGVAGATVHDTRVNPC